MLNEINNIGMETFNSNYDHLYLKKLQRSIVIFLFFKSFNLYFK